MKKKIKLLVFLALFISFFSFAGKVFASDWVISTFDSKLNIRSDGKLEVTETIELDFKNENKHGIFRYLPVVYQEEGGKRYTKIENVVVKRNGSSEKFVLENYSDYLRIKIGDPDKTISREHTYELSYLVTGVLNGFENYDELYWNVTGNDWEVPIEKVSSVVGLPAKALIQSSCYQGLVGSQENCEVSNEEDSAIFGSTRVLETGEGLTVAVGYQKGLIPLLSVSKPRQVSDDLFKLPSIAAFFLALVGGIVLVFSVWFKKGRDFWNVRKYFGQVGRETIKPLSAHETIVVEFSPPENLRPAELGALRDERADTLDVTATLIDLANRGFLTIKEEKKKWLFGSTDYILTKVEKDDKSLYSYEKKLLDKLFDDGSEVKLSELKNKFYKDLALIKDDLYKHMVDKKFFVENPQKVRTNYTLLSLVPLFLGGGLIWLGLASVQALLVSFGAGLLIVAVLALIMAQSMPRRTSFGSDTLTRVKGYQMFVERAEKYRQQFFERKNLFSEVLPYAIVFGVTQKFAKAFKDMGLESQQPSWYSGSRPFNAVVFGQSMNSFSMSFSQTIASSPSSSGSGGGGSSGGGFGGGGGGSW